MQHAIRSIASALILSLGLVGIARAHCEIPCGIYGDLARIHGLLEDIRTVEKSMEQVVELSKNAAANANQLVRWVGNKEEHANRIQHVVTQYFMTQRIKPVEGDGADARDKYVKELTMLHKMLVHAMKAKQTTDTSHTAALRKLVDSFAASYLSPEDLEHVREHHGGK